MSLDEDALFRERCMAEWKANIDLHRWHEDLKQARLRNYITIQTALIAGWSFTTYQMLSLPRLSFFGLSVMITFLGAIHSCATWLMDRRAALYVQKVKSCLRDLEKEWNNVFQSNQFRPYTRQGKTFARADHNQSLAQRTLSYPAALVDRRIIELMTVLWGMFLTGTVLIMLRYRLHLL